MSESAAVVILFGTTTTFVTPYNKSATAQATVFNGNAPYDLSDSVGNSQAFLNFQFILISVIVGAILFLCTRKTSLFYLPFLFCVSGFPLLAVTSKSSAWSVAYTSFFISALTIMWAQLLKGFWWNGRYTYHNPSTTGWNSIPLGWDSLLLAVYIAATVQIAYSAVAGRASFAQA